MSRLACAIVIPARLGSTRLPGKLLLAETGKPLIQHTYEAASRARRATRVLVASEDPQIVEVVRGFGGAACLTGPAPTGTDRIAQAIRDPAAGLTTVDLIVNVQGDEPEIEPEAIDRVVELLEQHPTSAMATLATPIRDLDRFRDPACVKVVFDAAGRALYFSRSPIPFLRDARLDLRTAVPALAFAHIGLYGYRRALLEEFVALPPAPAETAESLEQLRALHAGWTVQVGVVPAACKGIDTQADYRAFVSRQAT